MKTHLKTGVAALALSGALALTANQALAGGFAIREQSALGLGAAFAGAAAGYDNDLSGIFFNPATLALNTGFNAQAEASVIAPSSKITVTSGGADSGNIGELAVVPSTYVGYQVNSKFSFGVGVNSPFGLVTKSPLGWGGSTHALKSEMKSININPVVSYRISPMLSVGLGVQMDYLEAELTNFNGVGVTTLKGKDKHSFGITAGLLFEPTSMTRIGIGYRSHIKHKLKGTVVNLPAPASIPITAKFTSPETVTVSLQQKINSRFKLMGSIEWANWSRFRDLTIRTGGVAIQSTYEGWKDSWFFSGGAEFKPTMDTAVRVGAAYEKSPVSDATRTPRIPDNDRIWLTVGGSMKVFNNITLNASYAHIFVKDGAINQPHALSFPALPPLTGTVKSSLNIFSLSAKIPL